MLDRQDTFICEPPFDSSCYRPIKVLLLQGGPGATHEYLDAFDSYFPAMVSPPASFMDAY
jgi:hypothetical protein